VDVDQQLQAVHQDLLEVGAPVLDPGAHLAREQGPSGDRPAAAAAASRSPAARAERAVSASPAACSTSTAVSAGSSSR
jgi:hypothetical protein